MIVRVRHLFRLTWFNIWFQRSSWRQKSKWRHPWLSLANNHFKQISSSFAGKPLDNKLFLFAMRSVVMQRAADPPCRMQGVKKISFEYCELDAKPTGYIKTNCCIFFFFFLLEYSLLSSLFLFFSFTNDYGIRDVVAAAEAVSSLDRWPTSGHESCFPPGVAPKGAFW